MMNDEDLENLEDLMMMMMMMMIMMMLQMSGGDGWGGDRWRRLRRKAHVLWRPRKCCSPGGAPHTCKALSLITWPRLKDKGIYDHNWQVHQALHKYMQRHLYYEVMSFLSWLHVRLVVAFLQLWKPYIVMMNGKVPQKKAMRFWMIWMMHDGGSGWSGGSGW